MCTNRFSLDGRGNLLEFEEYLPRRRAETFGSAGLLILATSWDERPPGMSALLLKTASCSCRLEAQAQLPTYLVS